MDESHSNLNGEQRLPSGTTFKLEPEKDKKIKKKLVATYLCKLQQMIVMQTRNQHEQEVLDPATQKPHCAALYENCSDLRS